MIRRSRLADTSIKIMIVAMAIREVAETYFRIRYLMDQVSGATKEREGLKGNTPTPELFKLTFKDIIGFENVKSELRSPLEWVLRHRELMRTYDVQPINGICLFGPPGCGKTHFVRCAAGEFGVNLYLASPSNIGSMWYGQTEKRIRRLFEEARKNSPSIIAIDEADKLLPRSSLSSVQPRVLSEFLQNMDGLLSEEKPVVMILMSNEPWKIHEAIIRRGRVDRLIYVPPPDYETRVALFRHYMHKVIRHLDENVNFEELGKLTEPSKNMYYSSAAIREICRTVKDEAFKSALATGRPEKISMLHFQSALLKVPPDIDGKLNSRYQQWADTHASYKS